ncbi:hypothetical protein WDW86_11590 [Bdellovibrionota bacterium FG-2]
MKKNLEIVFPGVLFLMPSLALAEEANPMASLMARPNNGFELGFGKSPTSGDPAVRLSGKVDLPVGIVSGGANLEGVNETRFMLGIRDHESPFGSQSKFKGAYLVPFQADMQAVVGKRSRMSGFLGLYHVGTSYELKVSDRFKTKFKLEVGPTLATAANKEAEAMGLGLKIGAEVEPSLRLGSVHELAILASVFILKLLE